MKFWDYIKWHMLRHSESTISEDCAVMTYEELVIWSENYAKRLIGKECVAIICDSEMAAAMAMLACFAADVTAVPISKRYGENHYMRILKKLNPEWIITDGYEELKVIKNCDGDYKIPKKKPALIMFTSGTTGEPKGAMIHEDNLIGNIKDIAMYFGIDKNDRILISRPIYHCAVLTGEYLISLFKGVNIRFYSGKFNPVILAGLIQKYNITVFCGTPTLMGMIAATSKGINTAGLKTIVISGECLARATAKRIRKCFKNTNIYHVYGLTEACPRVCYLPPDKFDVIPESIGIPLKSNMVRVINDEGKIADPDEEGVLWVHGNIMMGYYDDCAATEKVIRNGWLCTGDRAAIDKDGYVRIKGRDDDLIIRAGMNIYPQEIESAVKSDERVKEVLAYPLHKNDVTLVGIDISGDFTDIDEVRKICREHLCDYQMPAHINIVTELEKNGSGKIIRKRN